MVKSTLKKMYKLVRENINDNLIITIQYLKIFKKLPNTKNPKSFSEKIHIIKKSNWLEDKSVYVDKYLVRNYIENKIGKEYLIKLYGVYKNVEEIDFNKLPNKFVLKLNNGSGCNLIVKDKKNLMINETKQILNEWLKSNFYMVNREKQYKNVEQLIICEEYLQDLSGELMDYKFFCLGGKVRVIQVDIGRFSNIKRDFYDIYWNKLNLKKGVENSDIILEKPEKLEEMIKLSEKLSKDVELLRVDFYYVNNKIYFGELTFTPANGMTPFEPKEKDFELASYINVKKYL